MVTLGLHQKGLDIKEIAQQRGYAHSTVVGHLSELLAMNQPVALNDLVEPDRQKIIIAEITKYGDRSLSLLKDKLDRSYTFDELKLVRGWWRSQQN